MKKVLISCLVVTMILSSISAFAADVLSEENMSVTESYAYMNLENAPVELQDKIIEARNEIIFSQSWGLEGGYIIRADGTVENVPKFYDIFPEEWELPRNTVLEDFTITGAEIEPLAVTGWNINVYFDNLPPSGISPTTGNFYHDGSYIQVKVNSLTASQHCNVGVTNNNTGASIGFAEILYPGDRYYCPTLTLPSFYAGIRHSTYSNPGYGVLNVTHDEAGFAR